jgi:2-polyprenyl-3-methyl-5-hydroxy-6-metoxy-1,4-benzoquinol methylase
MEGDPMPAVETKPNSHETDSMRVRRRLRGDSEEYVRTAARDAILGTPRKFIDARVNMESAATPSIVTPMTFRDGPTGAPPPRPGAITRNVADIEMFYNTIAERFDDIMNRYDVQRRIETIYDVLLGGHDLSGRTLLDAGCGTGLFSAAACERGAVVTALDIGPRLLEQVRRKCSARTVVGDVMNLDFRDGTFDVIVSSECIEHTTDPRRAVSELIRVCKPGGLIAISCPNRRWQWACTVANALKIRPYEGIENWPSRRGLRKWITESGATIQHMRGIHLFPFQVKMLQPVLRQLDAFGEALGPWCVNQAVLAIKS